MLWLPGQNSAREVLCKCSPFRCEQDERFQNKILNVHAEFQLFAQVFTILTTVIHAVEPDDVHSTEVKPLPYDLIKIWYGGGDGGDCVILVKG